MVEINKKIAVSSAKAGLDAPVDPRFGRCAGFMIVDPDSWSFEFIDNGNSQSLSRGAGIQAAENVARSGAACVLTGSVGPKAFQALTAAGIRVAQQMENMTVREAVSLYIAGKVELASQPNARGGGHR